MRQVSWVLATILSLATASPADTLAATGLTEPTQLDPSQFLGAVTVTFPDLPITMSFDLL
jgi:hypothetical protein